MTASRPVDDQRQLTGSAASLPPMAEPSRFLTLDDVADELATSRAQVYALVRRNELPALKLGGRGQWRVERDKLEEFIAHTYAETAQWVQEHPFAGDDDED